MMNDDELLHKLIKETNGMKINQIMLAGNALVKDEHVILILKICDLGKMPFVSLGNDNDGDGLYAFSIHLTPVILLQLLESLKQAAERILFEKKELH